MKNLKKIIVAGVCTAAVACGALALAGCGGSDSLPCGTVETDEGYYLVEDGKLTIGSDLDFPPMEGLDDAGNPTGFGVDMIQEVCNRIGLEMNFLDPQNFDSLVTQVNAGTTMDVAVSSMTITDERSELITFSDPYFDSNLAIVIKTDSGITDKASLNDASVTVAAQSGSSGEDWIKENLPNATLVTYNGPTDAVTALVADQCSAVVYDEPVAAEHVSNQFTECSILEVIPTGEQYGIAINQGNTKLIEAINNALADMESDGTMDALKAKYGMK